MRYELAFTFNLVNVHDDRPGEFSQSVSVLLCICNWSAAAAAGAATAVGKLHINWKSTFAVFQKQIAQFVKATGDRVAGAIFPM